MKLSWGVTDVYNAQESVHFWLYYACCFGSSSMIYSTICNGTGIWKCERTHMIWALQFIVVIKSSNAGKFLYFVTFGTVQSLLGNVSCWLAFYRPYFIVKGPAGPPPECCITLQHTRWFVKLFNLEAYIESKILELNSTLQTFESILCIRDSKIRFKLQNFAHQWQRRKRDQAL